MDLMSIIRALGLQGAGGPPPPLRMPESYVGQIASMNANPGYAPSRMDEVGATIGGLPMEQGPNAPETPKVTTPMNAMASASAATPAAAVPPTQKKHGLGHFLESIFMPEADSRWAAALRGGIYDAKANQAKYKAGEVLSAEQEATARANRAIAENKVAHGDNAIAGNNVVHYGPDGQVSFITPPQQPSEMERLIDKWRDPATDPATKAIIERAIRGYQYSPEVVNAKADAQLRTGTALAAARGAQARLTKRTPGATATGSGRAKIKPPTGFILE